jgi:hypothetical protein
MDNVQNLLMYHRHKTTDLTLNITERIYIRTGNYEVF